jgi:AraC family transcriptional regulator
VEPRIISKDAFYVIGVELKTTTQNGRNFEEIPAFWEKIIANGLLEKIPNKRDAYISLGICMDMKEDGSFLYIIGTEVTSTENLPDGMVVKLIPSATYAVFTARGEIPSSIQKMVRYINKEWLPESNYQLANTPDFELYDERSMSGANVEVEIYVPVIKVK